MQVVPVCGEPCVCVCVAPCRVVCWGALFVKLSLPCVAFGCRFLAQRITLTLRASRRGFGGRDTFVSFNFDINFLFVFFIVQVLISGEDLSAFAAQATVARWPQRIAMPHRLQLHVLKFLFFIGI